MSTLKKKPRSTRLAALALICLGVLFASSCTPEEITAASALRDRQDAVLTSMRTKSGLTDDQLARLANCESSGNPAARSASGKYLGLYQFDQRTWNGTAASVLPEYVGVSPAAAPPEIQSAMARFLYFVRGRSPWPVCGRRL